VSRRPPAPAPRSHCPGMADSASGGRRLAASRVPRREADATNTAVVKRMLQLARVTDLCPRLALVSPPADVDPPTIAFSFAVGKR
jgi:hypothetical protein